MFEAGDFELQDARAINVNLWPPVWKWWENAIALACGHRANGPAMVGAVRATLDVRGKGANEVLADCKCSGVRRNA